MAEKLLLATLITGLLSLGLRTAETANTVAPSFLSFGMTSDATMPVYP
ncbi:MAG: hypothetical protein KME12_06150 [Trichocoleus desertorum ATA4-8-CV12]|jgi:hypothetical protein|nr:hypothetical protein [Trichocoleus desertorum ATA4-8-CV12]